MCVSALNYVRVLCVIVSVSVFPASPWLPCQNAVRHQDVNDPTTWLTSPVVAAPITPAPPQTKKRRRGEKQEEEEEERRGRRKFPTTLGKARRRTWLNAQVKRQASTVDLFLAVFLAYLGSCLLCAFSYIYLYLYYFIYYIWSAWFGFLVFWSFSFPPCFPGAPYIIFFCLHSMTQSNQPPLLFFFTNILMSMFIFQFRPNFISDANVYCHCSSPIENRSEIAIVNVYDDAIRKLELTPVMLREYHICLVYFSHLYGFKNIHSSTEHIFICSTYMQKHIHFLIYKCSDFSFDQYLSAHMLYTHSEAAAWGRLWWCELIEMLSKLQHGQVQCQNPRSWNLLIKAKCVTRCHYKWGILMLQRCPSLQIIFSRLVILFSTDSRKNHIF